MNWTLKIATAQREEGLSDEIGRNPVKAKDKVWKVFEDQYRLVRGGDREDDAVEVGDRREYHEQKSTRPIGRLTGAVVSFRISRTVDDPVVKKNQKKHY